MKPSVRFLLNLSLAIVILIILIFNVDFTGLINNLIGIKIVPFLISMSLAFFMRLIWAYQVSFGLAPLALKLNIRDLFRFSLVSTFYSLIFPGELVAGTIAWLRLSFPIRKEIELGTLLIYFRLLNTLTLLLIGGIGAWFDYVLASTQFRIFISIMFVCVFVMFIPFFQTSLSITLIKFGNTIINFLPFSRFTSPKLERIWTSIEVFHKLRIQKVFFLIVVSFLFHFTGIFAYYLLTLAVEIDLSIFLVGWIRSILSVLQMIPITIGGLGIRESSIVLILANYDVSITKSLVYSFTIFFLILIPGLVGGLLEGFNLLVKRN
jgi:glycosyltransferase 2 family protein